MATPLEIHTAAEPFLVRVEEALRLDTEQAVPALRAVLEDIDKLSPPWNRLVRGSVTVSRTFIDSYDRVGPALGVADVRDLRYYRSGG